MAAKYGIKSIPTMLIFKNGELKNQLVGSMPLKEVETRYKKMLKKDYTKFRTDEGRKTVKMRPERIKEVNDEIEKMGAKVIEQYAVLGEYDFINILDAPDNETISRISIELGCRGTIQLVTLAAIPIDELEGWLMTEIKS